MARLEHIHYEFFEASLESGAGPDWVPEEGKKAIERLPQTFWEDGSPWNDANVWALEMAAANAVRLETVQRVMKYLLYYANFLEAHSMDWRHFPMRKEDRALDRYRKHLIEARGLGMLANSTATNCMNTAIRFYRFSNIHNLIDGPMWVDRIATIPFFDTTGFKRTMVRVTTDLTIPNRTRTGTTLEGGLLPLRPDHMTELLAYLAREATDELSLMLSVGFFTGARVGTVSTLSVTSLHTAREDPHTRGLYLLHVGPPTSIATKSSVSGELIVPAALLGDLKRYATSTTRLLREAKAHKSDKNRLFLSRSGRPYSVGTVDRLVHDMRQKAVAAGMQFMKTFKFHQSRATFGTWLVKILLDSGCSTTTTIEFVRDALLHKHERDTFGYITFHHESAAAQEAAKAFNEAFTGLYSRDWNKTDA